MTRVQRAVCAIVGAMSAVAMSGVVPAPGAAAPAMPYSAVSKGLAPLMSAPAPTESRAPTAIRSRGARQRPAPAPAAAGRTAVPAVGSELSGAASGALRHDFNGVGSRDSEFTNFNQEFEPPDQGLCSGNGFVIDQVNSAYRIYNTVGRTVRGPFNINDMFDEGAAEFTSDPRCYFDASTDRWFATVLFLNAALTRGRVDIAVSDTGDPTGLWRQYRIDTSDLGGNGCPCFGDQPRMGIDRNNIYISDDEYSINGPQYNGGQLYAVAKHDLVSGARNAHFVHWADLRSGGALALAIEPAFSDQASAAEYFLNSLDPNLTFDNRLGVWALTHGNLVESGGMPTLSTTVIQSEPYGLPPGAQQKGASSRLDSGDDRMQQTQYIDGLIWGELTTGVTIPGDRQQRAGAAWFAVRPHLSNGKISSAAVARQGYVVSSGQYVIYPAVQADPAGRAAMVFTLTGTGTFPSAAYTTLPSTGNRFGTVTVAASGTGPYDPSATRWGDYSFAVLDPTADAVWLATEYIPPKSSQTTDGKTNWGTRVLEVALS